MWETSLLDNVQGGQPSFLTRRRTESFCGHTFGWECETGTKRTVTDPKNTEGVKFDPSAPMRGSELNPSACVRGQTPEPLGLREGVRLLTFSARVTGLELVF